MVKHLEKEIKEELLENKPKAKWEYEKTLLLDTLLKEFKENIYETDEHIFVPFRDDFKDSKDFIKNDDALQESFNYCIDEVLKKFTNKEILEITNTPLPKFNVFISKEDEETKAYFNLNAYTNIENEYGVGNEFYNELEEIILKEKGQKYLDNMDWENPNSFLHISPDIGISYIKNIDDEKNAYYETYDHENCFDDYTEDLVNKIKDEKLLPELNKIKENFEKDIIEKSEKTKNYYEIIGIEKHDIKDLQQKYTEIRIPYADVLAEIKNKEKSEKNFEKGIE